MSEGRAGLPVVAVLLAGGTGSRAGSAQPKQFVRVAGKPLLQHTLAVFQSSARVHGIVIVADPAFSDEIAKILGEAEASKVMAVVPPGVTRAGSTRNALQALGPDEVKILVHDAVRPLVDERIIADCVDMLDVAVAVDVVVPTADTIVVVEDGTVVDIPDRSTLRRGQTPQAFLLSVLRRAYEGFLLEPDLAVTDDCAVVRAFCPEEQIATVVGAEENIKVTHPQDFLLVDQLFRLRQSNPPLSARGMDGQHHVVVGGTGGIGEAVVSELRSRGAEVVALGRRTGVDVRDEESIVRALDRVARRCGRIDGVVLTAGVLSTGSLVGSPSSELVAMVETNVLGAINTARAAHPHLVRSAGHLLFFSSSSYTRGRAGQAAYSATKAAVSNLTQGLSEEWRESGARVNCISPGRTATSMRAQGFGEVVGLQRPEAVARIAADVLLSTTTGSIVDVPPFEVAAVEPISPERAAVPRG